MKELILEKEILTELRVKKITGDDLIRLQHKKVYEVDLGCGIRICDASLPFGGSFTAEVQYKTPSYEYLDFKCTCNCDDCNEMALFMNHELTKDVFDKFDWDYIECDDYWSLNPSSYFSYIKIEKENFIKKLKEDSKRKVCKITKGDIGVIENGDKVSLGEGFTFSTFLRGSSRIYSILTNDGYDLPFYEGIVQHYCYVDEDKTVCKMNEVIERFFREKELKYVEFDDHWLIF